MMMSQTGVLMPFALCNTTGCIVGIDEVDRGNQCNCRCLSCSTPVTARQGESNQNHFAHRTDEASTVNECHYSPLTALALILRQELPTILALQVDGCIYEGLKWSVDTKAFGVVIDVFGIAACESTIAIEVPFANGVGLCIEELKPHVDAILSVNTNAMVQALYPREQKSISLSPNDIIELLLENWADWVSVIKVPVMKENISSSPQTDTEYKGSINSHLVQFSSDETPSQILCRCCNIRSGIRAGGLLCNECVFKNVGHRFPNLTEMARYYRDK
ncbi:hypothetical protein [Photobacterium halotolerans]|uniref:Competence protein CoiA-like N-terminal domain-containing protein n=1 Tax=Photobacterium halotolerans TaxID=265726 RepID=A0A7X4WCX1_9GAMM|nr:hypothetical protein [Photobacterium halotolerans]NAW66353.1 hypothetical protein [Photobacterium halotolerans]